MDMNPVIGRSYWLPVIIVFMMIDTGCTIMADPSVHITSPLDGERLTNHLVNVTGNATGSPEEWVQTSKEDFDAGTMDNVTTNDSGDLFLDEGIYDDFQSNSLDPTKWHVPEETNGLTSSIVNQMYCAYGTSNTSNDVNPLGAETMITSAQTFKNSVSGLLFWFCGTSSGTHESGYWTAMGISWDTNYFEVGFRFERQENNFPFVYIEIKEQGESHFFGAGYIPPSDSANFQLSWNDTNILFHMDDNLLLDHAFTFSSPINPYFYIKTAAKDLGDSVTADWDNIIINYTYSGNFTSTVLDTGYQLPKLTFLTWNADVPAGTSLEVGIRSSANSDMINSSPWTPLTNKQDSGFPDVMGFLQYRVTFHSTDGLISPIVHDVTIGYDIKSITEIDVSIDNKASWLKANGTDNWHILIDLPENTTVIWARALHPAGDFDTVSIRVDVDTTPPLGWVIINNGDEFTANPNVILLFNASDRYGISSVMVGEDPLFNGAVWRDFQSLTRFILSSGDGKRTIYVKFKDTSGWESDVVNDSIILDTTAPISDIMPLPAILNTTNFTVSWTGTDALSGLHSFDIQYQDNGGNWTNWQMNTNATNALFIGLDGHQYSFRVRAQDNIGNIQPYPSSGTTPVQITLPSPGIFISSPGPNSKVRGTVNIKGIANDTQADLKVVEVLVCVDNGDWQKAQGTNSWTLKWQTINLTDGPHTLRAKAFDGRKYSPEATVTVMVDNGSSNVSVEAFPYFLLSLIVLLAIVITGLLVYRLKKKRTGI